MGATWASLLWSFELLVPQVQSSYPSAELGLSPFHHRYLQFVALLRERTCILIATTSTFAVLVMKIHWTHLILSYAGHSLALSGRWNGHRWLFTVFEYGTLSMSPNITSSQAYRLGGPLTSSLDFSTLRHTEAAMFLKNSLIQLSAPVTVHVAFFVRSLYRNTQYRSIY